MHSVTMKVLRDLPFSRNQPPKAADDHYIGNLNKKRQCTYKTTLWRVRVTIVALRKQ